MRLSTAGRVAAAIVLSTLGAQFACVVAASASGLSTIYTFNSYCDGVQPQGALLYATDGNYYGVASYGGTNNDGTVYRLSQSGTLTTLHSFTRTGSDGADPAPGLTEASNGLIYGAATSGGPLNGGSIFSINPANGSFAVVATFDSSNSTPCLPSGGLVSDGHGHLFGVMREDGNGFMGCVYKINIDGSGLTVLYSFPTYGLYGQASDIPLVLDGSTLYGISNYDYGTIYSVSTSGASFTTLYTFTSGGSAGYYPTGLLLGEDGNLYITATYGGTTGFGVIDAMAPSATSPTPVYTFTNGTDGAYPSGSLAQDSSGTLYGVAASGGVDSTGQPGDGVVFSLSPSGSGFQALATLPASGADGGYASGMTVGPGGALITACRQDPEMQSDGAIDTALISGGGVRVLHDMYAQGMFSGATPYYGGLTFAGGNYYGTTSSSPTYWGGTLFEMTPSGQVSFPYVFGTDGSGNASIPYTNPVIGFDGQLIGVTYGGGAIDAGSLYGFDYMNLSESDLFDLNVTNGANPDSNLLVGNDGNYYFTTRYGGLYNEGAIVQVQPDGYQGTVVYSFTGADDGLEPYGNIVQSSTKTIYGTCPNGGANGAGVLWSWSASSGFQVVHPFNGAVDGTTPNGVIIGRDGRLYGTCYSSSAGSGLVYAIAQSGGALDILHDFNYSTDGGYPVTAPIQGSTGLIYGTCSQGGIGGYGTIWQVGTAGGSFAVLGSFADDNTTTGGFPEGQVTEGQDGNLYGTTEIGGIEPYPGTNVKGTIYEVRQSLPVIDGIVDSVTDGPSGLGGDSVTIAGANLSKVTAVKFNGAAVSSFMIVSPTEIATTVPDTATSGPVTATTSNRGKVTSSETFTIVPPSISSLSETSGLAGDTVTITGANFVDVLDVTFGTVAATYTVVSPTEIMATAPANGRSGPVRVVTEGGTAASPKLFVYKGPQVFSFKPTSGPVGTSVTISGSNFAGVSSVTFDGVAATAFTVNSATSITATVPTGATTGPVAVTTPGGTKTSTAKFTVN